MLVGKRVVGSSPPSDVGKGVRCDLSDQEAEIRKKMSKSVSIFGIYMCWVTYLEIQALMEVRAVPFARMDVFKTSTG
jgi:hypothetical protein